MNFALMFALAVGIDYALFVVVRFRAALRAGLRPLDAVGETMDSAGKAVLVSGLAVLASVSAVMVVPSQPFRTSALGILLAVGFVLAASLTLLPALLVRLGSRIDSFALPWAGAVQHRSEGIRSLGALDLAPPRAARRARGWLCSSRLRCRCSGCARRCPRPACCPATPARASATSSCSGLRLRRAGGAAGRRAAARGSSRRGGASDQRGSHGRARRRSRRGGLALIRAAAAKPGQRQLVDRLRDRLPRGALVGGAAAEARDLEHALAARTSARLRARGGRRLRAPAARRTRSARRRRGRVPQPAGHGSGFGAARC